MNIEIIIYAAICFAAVATVNYIVGYKVGKRAGMIAGQSEFLKKTEQSGYGTAKNS